MIHTYSDDEYLMRFYVVHTDVSIIPKGLISEMV